MHEPFHHLQTKQEERVNTERRYRRRLRRTIYEKIDLAPNREQAREEMERLGVYDYLTEAELRAVEERLDRRHPIQQQNTGWKKWVLHSVLLFFLGTYADLITVMVFHGVESFSVILPFVIRCFLLLVCVYLFLHWPLLVWYARRQRGSCR